MVWTAWNAPKIEIMALVLKHCDLFIAENRKLLPSYRNKPAQMIKTGEKIALKTVIYQTLELQRSEKKCSFEKHSSEPLVC